MLKENAFYYLRFNNGRHYLLKYKGYTHLGHGFKLGASNIYISTERLAAENPVLWKVKK